MRYILSLIRQATEAMSGPVVAPYPRLSEEGGARPDISSYSDIYSTLNMVDFRFENSRFCYM